MILVHGIQDFALSLGPLAEAFRDRFRVVAFDLRGHGDSDKPGVYTLPHHLADLHAVVTQLGLQQPVLVGHSLGGQIVSQYAGVFPEVPARVISVEGLGPPFRDLQTPADLEQWRTRTGIESLLHPSSVGRPMPDLEDAIQLFCRYHPRMPVESARNLVELGTEEHPAGGLRWKWDPRVQTTWLSAGPEQTQRRWSWIECPVLLVTGSLAHEFWSRNRGMDAEAVQMDPDELARRIALFRDARHVEIVDAGHMVHYDKPAELVAVIREFLGARGSTR
jgi:pimeloyl-ACP methyl ester carboxylesterase